MVFKSLPLGIAQQAMKVFMESHSASPSCNSTAMRQRGRDEKINRILLPPEPSDRNALFYQLPEPPIGAKSQSICDGERSHAYSVSEYSTVRQTSKSLRSLLLAQALTTTRLS
ncbi:hypothetical protein GTP44_20840 [Duganella sp. FT50W]|uniref:Uncharacterized protein n=1 Tax=Duganella lactea TaxID=2692173 RepID=A0A6L8MME3_9BURK|nr:hypothetical protein [Duganella lactea]MYM84387.1 hypothetical protein [Duganella lactea]